MKRVLLTTTIACLAGIAAVEQGRNDVIDAGEPNRLTSPGWTENDESDEANSDDPTMTTRPLSPLKDLPVEEPVDSFAKTPSHPLSPADRPAEAEAGEANEEAALLGSPDAPDASPDPEEAEGVGPAEETVASPTVPEETSEFDSGRGQDASTRVARGTEQAASPVDRELALLLRDLQLRLGTDESATQAGVIQQTSATTPDPVRVNAASTGREVTLDEVLDLIRGLDQRLQRLESQLQPPD